MSINLENDVAAFTAVAAVGTAGSYIFFSVECNSAVAAVLQSFAST